MYIYNDTTSFTGLVDCDQFQVVISYLFNYYIKINHQLRITGAVTITIHSISFLSPQNLYLHGHVFSPLSLLFIINCNARLTPFPSSLNTTVDGLF